LLDKTCNEIQPTKTKFLQNEKFINFEAKQETTYQNMSLKPLTDALLKQLRSGDAEQVDIALTRIEAQGYDLLPWKREFTELSTFIQVPSGKNVFQTVAQIYAVKQLKVNQKELSSLPDSFRFLSQVEFLDASENLLTELPDWISEWHSLKELNVKNNQIVSIPKSIHQIEGLRKIDLSHNGLDHIPLSILGLKTLEELDLSHNEINQIPDEVGYLQGLELLNLSYNPVENCPESLGDLQSLTELNLSHATLTQFPLIRIAL